MTRGDSGKLAKFRQSKVRYLMHGTCLRSMIATLFHKLSRCCYGTLIGSSVLGMNARLFKALALYNLGLITMKSQMIVEETLGAGMIEENPGFKSFVSPLCGFDLNEPNQHHCYLDTEGMQSTLVPRPKAYDNVDIDHGDGELSR